jgi:hypothetical protein
VKYIPQFIKYFSGAGHNIEQLLKNKASSPSRSSGNIKTSNKKDKKIYLV